MERQLRYLENLRYNFQGHRSRATFYPWKSPHKLEPDCVTSCGANPRFIEIFDRRRFLEELGRLYKIWPFKFASVRVFSIIEQRYF